MKHELKRKYLLASMKLIMSSSFIVEKLGSLGTISPRMKALIEKTRTADERETSGRLNSKMSKVIKIEAPLSTVFDYVTVPSNWTRFVTGLIEVRALSGPVPQQGTTIEWAYRMIGVNFEGKDKISEFETDRKFALTMNGAFPIHQIFQFEGGFQLDESRRGNQI